LPFLRRMPPMPRRFVVALALVSALTGCIGSPPNGPLVEYRDGLTPITRRVPCDATYRLCRSDDPNAAPLAEPYVKEGQRVGFRREKDGSVIGDAAGCTVELPPGAYRWEVVPESVPPLRDRVRQRVREDVLETAAFTGNALLLGGIVLLAIALSTAYGMGKANSGIR
jgi:hypothetical protein